MLKQTASFSSFPKFLIRRKWQRNFSHLPPADYKNVYAKQIKQKMELEVISDKKANTLDPPANSVSAPGRVIKERSAEIVAGGSVFYNPVQEFNRDLSIAVLNVFARRLLKERKKEAHTISKESGENATGDELNGESALYTAGVKYENGIRILEALSATGLRSIRYAKEIAGVREIIANDLSKAAVDSILENVRHNGVENLIEPSQSDAMTLMYLSTSNHKRFDAIDLDPYGCPNRFLDGAVQSITNGGLLLVTATDMAVLAGNTPEACYAKYGSVPLRMKCCHEMALRILLHSIETHANRYGKYIEPLLSISADFYVRVFVRVHSSQAKCKYSMSKQSVIFQCTGCDTFTLQPMGNVKTNTTAKGQTQTKFGIPTGPYIGMNCAHCGHKHHMGGPLWSNPIHDKDFVNELLQTIEQKPLSDLGTQKRLQGVLSVVHEELHDVPLYYVLDKLCCVLKLENIPVLKFRSALLHAGHRVSFSHACKNSIKTDAPAAVLWDILRCWAKRHPVKSNRMVEGTPLKAILEREPEKEYIFDDIHPEANPNSRRNALTRFQANPTAHWGPGTRATIMIGQDKVAKSHRNQNKKQKQRDHKNCTPSEKSDEEQSKSKQPKLEA
ncbi:PREDICTED: probable tRNA (guanine(26)-N(2))-dimethyltransferase [Rhagoletis zephyria]|uniref:probable tRNA (guanine(26)-N(2))-dimethyltransferase n=1 Tax=Rhagoletis zephyria TaxID=28612 RepID=UPI0008115025|nr:PREDICTED: probable tRNA (guanine(26)-N(2))-dimethyltransferase [Rhagoletis zephyria]